MYKRILALALLAALLLTGCQSGGKYPTDDTYHPDTDCAFYSTMINRNTQVAETENGYYLSIASFLMYTDRETMTTLPVCSKPHCLHNEETDLEKRELCDAYTPSRSPVSPIFYMKPYLYLCVPLQTPKDHYALVRMDEDGTNRTELFAFLCDGVMEACIHRGVFYYIQNDWSSGSCVSTLYAHPLDQKSGAPAPLYAAESNLSHNNLSGLIAYGNRLYFNEYVTANDTVLNIYDLQAGKLTTVPLPSGTYSTGTPFIAGGKLIVDYRTTPRENTDLKEAYYRYNLDGSNPELILSDRDYGKSCADEQYIYLSATQSTSDGKTTAFNLYILNRNLEEVCRFDLSTLYADGQFPQLTTLQPLHGEQLLLQTYLNGEFIYHVFDRAEIESGTIHPQPFFTYRESNYT